MDKSAFYCKIALHMEAWQVLFWWSRFSAADLRHVQGASGRLVNSVICIKKEVTFSKEEIFYFNIVRTRIETVIKPE